MRNFNQAKKDIDKLIGLMPEYESFRINDIIRKSTLSKDEKKEALLNDAIEILMLKEGLLEYTSNTKLFVRLTNKSYLGDLKSDQALINPATHMHNKVIEIPSNPKSRSLLEVISWIIGIVAGCFAIYEFIKKILR